MKHSLLTVLLGNPSSFAMLPPSGSSLPQHQTVGLDARAQVQEDSLGRPKLCEQETSGLIARNPGQVQGVVRLALPNSALIAQPLVLGFV
jgi:hypothetical protein